MTIRILKNVLGFLERTQLKGGEAYAYVEAHTMLLSMIQSLEKTSPAVPTGPTLTATE
jgi:hypothetical protein